MCYELIVLIKEMFSTGYDIIYKIKHIYIYIQVYICTIYICIWNIKYVKNEIYEGIW